MCGIVALLRQNGAPVTEPEIVRMRDSMTHRGPDDSGVLIDGNVGLGHRRLNVIDLAGGHQPMANADGTVHVVFNGEIYNYRELRTLLSGRGVALRTNSDTETILGLYDLFGEDLLSHLRGMFAFALWDARRRRLLAARDRFGIKPLYVLRRGSCIAFASEIKALLLAEEAAPTAAEETFGEYLVYRSLGGRRTMFRDVERVGPGELLIVDAGGETRRTYWKPPRARETESAKSVDEWVEELEALLRAAVVEHTVSDVPLGVFLSGGIDSSLVTAFCAGLFPNSLNTFSVGFKEADCDETPYANEVARRFGTTHHSLIVGEREYVDWLPQAIWHHDEPLGHPHSVHIHYLSRLAREKVTVVLTGEGSDELFAGYTRYRLIRVLDRIPLHRAWVRRLLGTAALRFSFPGSLRMRAVLDGDEGIRLAGLAAFVAPTELRRLRASASMPADRCIASTPQLGLLGQALFQDQQVYLEALLNRLDKMNMSTSLEGRVPFLDHRLVEFAATVPPQLKLRGFETKYLLKRLARRHLPAKVIDRPKAGFGIPLCAWLRADGPLAPYLDLLLEPEARCRSQFDTAVLRQTAQQHLAGEADHSELLWGLINLELWQRVMLGHSAAAAAEATTSAIPPAA